VVVFERHNRRGADPMIPVFCPPDQIRWSDLLEHDELVRRYRAFFALFDWQQVPERSTRRPWPGPTPQPRSAYLKALVVKISEGKTFITDLRAYLVEHPLLVLSLGFHPVPDPNALYRFDVERTVPCGGWLCAQLRTLDETILSNLLRATVHALQGEIADLGETVAFDVKHIYAWVQENNPKAFLAQRFDPQRQPTGDPDCRLGIKRRGNQKGADGESIGPTEYVCGYGTGIASATADRYGNVVLAEVTQTFNENDATYFAPLYEQVRTALGQPPTNITADAAFDAWRIYATCVPTGGIAAIPLNLRGQAPAHRTPDGIPLCTKNFPLTPATLFVHEDGYRAQRFTCPLLHPTRTGATCSHRQFTKGGCTRVINLEDGGKLRIARDRASLAFQAIYDQRTSAERINSQATALGIERPKLHNQRSIRHLNTLIYLVINARALQRARAINRSDATAA
jgi:hypothetical protein